MIRSGAVHVCTCIRVLYVFVYECMNMNASTVRRSLQFCHARTAKSLDGKKVKNCPIRSW